jgi:hypothetical protein
MRGFTAVAAALVLVAAALRFWALDGGLPHPMSRPDEEVVLAHTAPLAAGHADLEYAVYPGAYLYLTWGWGAAGLRAAAAAGAVPRESYGTVLREHPERLLLVDRVLSALAGTATVALLVLVVRPALGDAAALVAGALLATSFLHARDSHAVKPEALLTLGVVAALGLMAALARRPTRGRAVALGVAIGLATGIKYPGLLLLVPAWIAAVCASPARGWRRLLPGAAVLTGVTALATFVVTSPFLFLNPQTRAAVLGVFASIFPQAFPGLAPPAVQQSLAALGERRAWWEGLVYHATFSLRYGAGLLPTLLAPLAVVWGFRDRRPLPLVAAVFAVVWYVVNGLSPMVLARYMTPLLPALALLEAGFLVAATSHLRDARGRAAVLVLAALVLIAEPLVASVGHDRVAANTDTRVLATAWLADNAPPGSRVAILGTRFWGYGEPMMPPGISMLRTDGDLGALAPEHADYLLTHDHPVFSSKVNPATLEALAPHLRPLAEFDPFVPGRSGAVFEYFDAYYVPVHGFAAVSRPGPHIRIYEIVASAHRR